SQILKIPEINIGTALDASRHLFSPRENPMPHETFDAFGRFIEILENDKRKMMSKSYVLNIAKGLFRGAKVTLLMLALCLFAAISRADDLVTISGKRYERVRITEITPATIAFTHATGAARLAFGELTPIEQKKYGYDPAKAQAW